MQGIKKDIDLQNKINALKGASGGSGAQQDVNDLTVEGVDDTTTAVAKYGINLVKVTTATDVACRLPVARTGGSCTIINTTNLPVVVYPSMVGGSINGILNGQIILGTNDPFTFYCTENPLPGAWTVGQPGAQQVESAEIQINFTSGGGDVYKFNSGVAGVANVSSVGSGMSGGPSSALILTGPWDTVSPSNGTISRLKMYTNIVAADLNLGNFKMWVLTAYQTSPTGSTSGVRMGHLFYGGDWQVVTGGPAYVAPGNVGDNGTLYKIVDLTGMGIGAENYIIGSNFSNGAPDIYSNGYFTYEMDIDDLCATKLYKYKFFLEYV